MAKWMITAKRADFDNIAARFGIDKVTARLIRNRDIIGEEEIEKYLHGSLADFYRPELMKDLDIAVDLILEGIDEGCRFRVIGDYDIDGIMATYILTDALKKAGAEVDHAIPDRVRDGYGINEELIRRAFEDGIQILITCDNGIAAARQAELAAELGMQMIITDHHSVPYEGEGDDKRYIVPEAAAVVDPKQEDCLYPYPELCGASVAWKLICSLFEALGFDEEEAFAYLQFAAVATVGDVVDLQDENRIIVKEGLKQLHNTEHIGLNALIERAGLDRQEIDTYQIGFILGPCLNATGRLDTAERALSLLNAGDREEALVAAGELCDLNEVRKSMTESELKKAIEFLEESGRTSDRVLVVYLPECHESLAGIIAGRIREKYNRPAFVLTGSKDGIKGSGRSTENYSMYDELVKVRDLLTKFGGHPMAAGVSMPAGKEEQFRSELNRLCELTEEDLEPVVRLDMRLPIGYLTEDLIRQFDLLRPFGKANEKPLFADKDLEIRKMAVLGRNRNVLKMLLADAGGNTVEALCFRDAEYYYEALQGRKSITVSYYPSVNEYRGRKTLQIVIRDLML